MGKFHYSKDSDNIVTISMDMTGPVNAMNHEYEVLMGETIDRLEAERENIKGVILTSSKSTFFAGGDLKTLVAVNEETVGDFFETNMSIKSMLRRLEQLQRPVVAAINGAALGGGFEICLACHHRIALDSKAVQIGLPEVTLGLLPGGGGVVRLVSKLGAERAFPFLMQGKKLRPAQALENDLIEALATDTDDMMAKAREWINNNPEAKNPWDEKGFKIPGGNIKRGNIMQLVQGAIPAVFKETKGILPAPKAILDTIAATLRVDFDTAIRIEGRELSRLVLTKEAKNIITAFFFQLNKINGGGHRPATREEITPRKVNKLGIIGAGMMGQGIAYSAAKAGIEVVLKDVEQSAADKGKAYSQTLLDKAVKKGRMDHAKRDAMLERITATTDNEALKGCDLIIEAVFENPEIKASVTKESEPMLAEHGVWGSNTSSLPISMLSDASSQADKFIGIHFFSPVDKMPLVEIITGDKTSKETLAFAFDFVQQIKKIPIIVNDSRGFFTSRVFSTFVDEGAKLLQEGVHPTLIENLAMQAGMPVGPLAVHDEVSQKLTLSIANSNKAIDESLGRPMIEGHVALDENAQKLIDKNRSGKAYGGGYYDYSDNGEKVFWPGVFEHWTIKEECPLPYQDIKDRFIFRQVLESIRCYEEKVLNSFAEGNIGSVMGIGFPQHLGGVFQHINTYGVTAFLERAKTLHEQYGDHFEPPRLLIEKAQSNTLFV